MSLAQDFKNVPSPDKKNPNYYFSKTKPENDITELDQQQNIRNNKI